MSIYIWYECLTHYLYCRLLSLVMNLEKVVSQEQLEHWDVRWSVERNSQWDQGKYLYCDLNDNDKREKKKKQNFYDIFKGQVNLKYFYLNFHSITNICKSMLHVISCRVWLSFKCTHARFIFRLPFVSKYTCM